MSEVKLVIVDHKSEVEIIWCTPTGRYKQVVTCPPAIVVLARQDAQKSGNLPLGDE
jgi:hypothetical protein